MLQYMFCQFLFQIKMNPPFTHYTLLSLTTILCSLYMVTIHILIVYYIILYEVFYTHFSHTSLKRKLQLTVMRNWQIQFLCYFRQTIYLQATSTCLKACFSLLFSVGFTCPDFYIFAFQPYMSRTLACSQCFCLSAGGSHLGTHFMQLFKTHPTLMLHKLHNSFRD